MDDEKLKKALRSAVMRFSKENFYEDDNPTAWIDKGERLLNALAAGRQIVYEYADSLKLCPCCNQPIGEVKTSFNMQTAVSTLYALVKWCSEKEKHEFEMKEVKHLLDHTQYANLNHLTKFGGIVYRPINPKTEKPYTQGHYGINLTRAWEFLRNERAAPVQITRDRLGRHRTGSTEKFLRDFPSIQEFLDEDGHYDPDHIVSDEASEPREDGLGTVPEHYTNK